MKNYYEIQRWVDGKQQFVHHGRFASFRHCVEDAISRGCDLRYAALNYRDLSDVDFSGLDLTGAGFCCTNLTGANLDHAILNDAALARAQLHRTILHRTYLHRADLSHADLSRADLTNAKFRNTHLTGTIGNGTEIKNILLDDDTYPVTYTTEDLQIGCVQFPIEKWWTFTDEEILAMDRFDPRAPRNPVGFWHKYRDIIRETIEDDPATPTN